MSFVTARQVVPAFGQSFAVAVQVPAALASQRQIGRQVFVPDIWLQSRPGAQSAACVQPSPSSLMRVASGQAQSTSSIAAGITQARPAGQPPRPAAAVARGDASFPMSRGEQLRDYLPVEAVASCLAELAVRCPGVGTINVCSGQPVSVRAFVEQLMERNGWCIALELGKYPVPDYEPLAFWGCSRRLRELLGTTATEV